MKKKGMIVIAILMLVAVVTLAACSTVKTRESILQSIDAEVGVGFSSLSVAEAVQVDAEKKEISVTVRTDAEEIDLSAITFDRAKMTVYADADRTTALNGKIRLEEGENTFYLTLTEDGVDATYTLRVTRKPAQTSDPADPTDPLDPDDPTDPDEPSEVHEHAFGDWTNVTPATCTEAGEKRRSCACGAEERERIEPLGHQEVVDPEIPATCTAGGTSAGVHCARCSAVLTAQTPTPALGHDHVALVTAPTCTQGGYTTHTCSRCGDSYVSDETAALGHDYGGWTIYTLATCIAEGEERRSCSRCEGYESRETNIDPDNHDLVHHDAQAATCTEAGWEAYDECTRCDYTTFAEIPASGHDYDEAITPSTCTAGGYTTYSCKHCDDSYVGDETPALGHSWDEGKVTTEPTYTSTGVRTYTCTRCSERKTEVIPMLEKPVHVHSYGDLIAERPAGCIEAGMAAHYYCEGCGGYLDAEGQAVTGESLILPARGHDYKGVTTDATCTAVGYTTYTCTRCGDSYIGDEVASLGHAYGEYVTTLDPTCTEKGEKARTCTRCSHVQREEIPASGHDYQSAVTAATCEAGGYTTYTCTRCGDSHTEEETPALGHEYGAWTTYRAATCSLQGEERRTCTRCDAYESRSIDIDPDNHRYEEKVTAPTCTMQGYTAHVCADCGTYYVTDYTLAIGHDYGEWVTVSAATCATKGSEKQTCSRCGGTKTRETNIDPDNHDLVHHDAQAATCTEVGWEAYDACSRCSYTTYEEIDALGHNWDDGEITTLSDTMTPGVLTFTCGRCGATDERALPCVPILRVSNGAVVWDTPTSATSYQVRVDNGDWSATTKKSVTLSASGGSHTIAVRSKNKSGVSPEATLAYTTVIVELSAITKSGRTVSWTATAFTVTLEVNDAATEYDLSDGICSYTCPAAAGSYDLCITADGGFDDDSKVYYYATKTLTKTDSVEVKTLGTPSLSATLADGICWVAIENASKYGVTIDGGSQTDNTSRKVALSTDSGSHTVTVKAIAAVGSVYLDSEAATYTYETRSESLSTLSVSGRTVSWTATADADAMTIYLNGASQGTASSCSDLTNSGTSYTYSGVPRTQGSYTVKVTVVPLFKGGVYYYTSSTLEQSKSVTISKLATPVLTKGTSAITWNAIANATNYANGSGTSLGTGRSVSYSTTAGEHSFRVKAVAASDSVYLDSDYSATFTYCSTPVALSDITFEGVRAKWVATARSVQVSEDSGAYVTTSSEHFDLTVTAGQHTVSVKALGGYDSGTNIFYSGGDKTKSATKEITLANTTLTFEDQTTDKPYATANGSTQAQYWTQEYWVSGSESWSATSNQMNSRASNTSRVVNLSSSTTKERFTYSTGSSFGVANSFSVYLGNYYTSYDIWYKIILIDTQDGIHYIAGATNRFVKFASTGTNNSNKVFTRITYTGFDPIEVKGIRFEVYGSTGGDSTYSYLYLDDVKISYEDTSAANAGQYKGDGSNYKGTSLTVAAGSYVTKDLSSGYANKATFTLKNDSTSTTYADLTLFNGDYMVATGRYVLYGGQSQGYTLLFHKCKVTKFMIAVASAGGVTLSKMSFSEDTTYESAATAYYRVPTASGDTSIQLMGANEVKSSTTLSFTTSGIKQLQKYASDISPLFSYLSNVTILSATYAQSINVLTTADSTGTYGTVTVKYVERGSTTITTSTVTIKRKDVARINNNDGGQSTRECYARNLYKEISVDPQGVILCGSSSMEKWESVTQDMKGITVADVGIGGTASTDWSADGGLAERLIYAFNPRAVVLFVGVNDLKYNSPVSTTTANVKALIQQIHTNLPNAQIYYVLINKVPLAISGSNQLTTANVDTFNSSMSSYAASYGWLTTIALDTTNRMVYNGGNAGDLTSFADSMHLNKAGYTEWAYVIRKTFLEGDNA